MSQKSKIEWLSGGDTWNPIRATNKARMKRGWFCIKVAPECKFCYAERMNLGPYGAGVPYAADKKNLVELYLDAPTLKKPLSQKRGRLIFPCSMTDLYADFVPDYWLDKIYAVMALTPHHTYLVLTKRPERRRAYLARLGCEMSRLGNEACNITDSPCAAHVEDVDWPLPNVWEGVSCGSQETADKWIPELLQTPAAVRWLSAEPMLGPIDLTKIIHPERNYTSVWNALTGSRGHMGGASEGNPRLSWCVVGGESGPGARPMNPNWARSLRDQCAAASVPFFFKQWGEWTPGRPELFRKVTAKKYSHEMFSWAQDGSPYCALRPPIDHFPSTSVWRVGKKVAGRLLDGVEYSEYPKVLQLT